ncbi:hypothetical protein A7981_06945 [Methylovorus sp. MM2]|uniref:hypothetical protein n=1 Tax=Methylovorus sp. MM2 TaxID=1848038 RepID=UPI0007DF8CEB|nr:hypothetical protein [Methylovorus sp. MM2]OAM53142.1 hypothetical protein A7981_06945 [Methylovorus sp. MM2]
MNQLLIARRASAVLYNFLINHADEASVYLIPANICPIVPAIFIKAGVRIIFIDISLETYCIDWSKCEEWANTHEESICHILYAHNYGYVDPNFGNKLARWKGLFPDSLVIDDRCLAEPSFLKQNELSDIELYSTGYSKLLEIGHGGWGIIKNQLKSVKWSDDFDQEAHEHLLDLFHNALDFNNKVDVDYSAYWLDQRKPIITAGKLPTLIKDGLHQSLERKKRLNTIYAQYLNEWALPNTFQLWRFNLWVEDAESLIKHVFEHGHFASRHYQSFAFLFDQKVPLNSALLGRHIINLFNDHRYDEVKAVELAELIRDYLSKK